MALYTQQYLDLFLTVVGQEVCKKAAENVK
jgi:hypothetical protein